jgi:Holliday junction DNA helicase RuvB
MGTKLHTTSGPQIERAGDLAGILTNLGERDLMFIDEIHRLHASIEEYLYPAIEDFRLDIIIDQGPKARTIRIDLPPFTLVGATTRAGMLTAPMRSRFGIPNRLDYYTVEEIQHILIRSARLMNVPMEAGGAREIARRSRGTPRIANHLLRWVRDYALVKASNEVTEEVASKALIMRDIDEDGLDDMDIRVLEALVQKFDGGPVGLGSIAVAVGEDTSTLEDVHEPYLVMMGYVKRTPRGRVAMPSAYRKLGLVPPHTGQTELF